MNKNKKGGSTPRYLYRYLGGNLIMNKFFKELENGFSEALTRNVLFFTLGWTIGTIVKLILESFIDSKNK